MALGSHCTPRGCLGFLEMAVLGSATPRTNFHPPRPRGFVLLVSRCARARWDALLRLAAQPLSYLLRLASKQAPYKDRWMGSRAITR